MWKHYAKVAEFTFNKSGAVFNIEGYTTGITYNVYNPPFKYPLISYSITSIDSSKYSIEVLDNMIYSISRWEQWRYNDGNIISGWKQIYCINNCRVDI